jgi:hypothetical protein
MRGRFTNACPIGHARETNSMDQDCRDPRQELDWTVHRDNAARNPSSRSCNATSSTDNDGPPGPNYGSRS